MEVVKRTSDYTIFQKRSKRYAVKGGDNKWINGEPKVKILLQEKLVEAKLPAAKPAAEEASAEEAAAEQSSDATEETSAE